MCISNYDRETKIWVLIVAGAMVGFSLVAWISHECNKIAIAEKQAEWDAGGPIAVTEIAKTQVTTSHGKGIRRTHTKTNYWNLDVRGTWNNQTVRIYFHSTPLSKVPEIGDRVWVDHLSDYHDAIRMIEK